MKRPIWQVLIGAGFGAVGIWLVISALHWWIPAVPEMRLWACGVFSIGLVVAIGGIGTAVREDWRARS